MTLVLKRKYRLDVKSHGNVKRMGKRETEKKKEKGRRREKRRKYGAQWLGSKGRIPDRVFLWPHWPRMGHVP